MGIKQLSNFYTIILALIFITYTSSTAESLLSFEIFIFLSKTNS